MKKLIISPVSRTESAKMIKQYLRDDDKVIHRHTFGDHVLIQSEMKEYVKAAYFRIKVSGPCQAVVNKFLEDRMIVRQFFVPLINSMVVEELVPNPKRLFNIVVHCISFDTGKTRKVELNRARVKGVRSNTAELIVQQEEGGSSDVWEWFLFDLLNNKRRSVCKGGHEFYLSADGNLFFPVKSWSQIGLVDLTAGIPLDIKNKCHFSRYATKVKIIKVIHFDPEQPCLFVLLIKQQNITFASLKKEACIKLTVTD